MIIKLKENEVPAPSYDHSFGVAVYSPDTNEWSEYHGDEYLDEGDIVVDACLQEFRG